MKKVKTNLLLRKHYQETALANPGNYMFLLNKLSFRIVYVAVNGARLTESVSKPSMEAALYLTIRSSVSCK